MKTKYILFAMFMTVVMVVSVWLGNLVYRLFTHTPFSFEAFTFSLLTAFISIYFYNRAEEMNKKED